MNFKCLVLGKGKVEHFAIGSRFGYQIGIIPINRPSKWGLIENLKIIQLINLSKRKDSILRNVKREGYEETVGIFAQAMEMGV